MFKLLSSGNNCFTKKLFTDDEEDIMEKKNTKTIIKEFDSAFDNNDVIEMENIYSENNLTQIPNCYYFIDKAVEEGKYDIVKWVLSKGCNEYSLYPKQMDNVNDHYKCAFLVEDLGV